MKTEIENKKKGSYFTKWEWCLWLGSLTLILVMFLLFDRSNWLQLTSSLVGATSLIFCAKGNPLGQILMLAFSVFYGIISWSFAYYGEVITYLGMTAPMAAVALWGWLRHPYQGKKSQVTVGHPAKRDIALMLLFCILVTVLFFFILRALHTANLFFSTLSITTSFLAVYLTFLRSPFYALAYAANDIVLITMWVMATLQNTAYVSVVVCFVIFLGNDLYGFINWHKLEAAQKKTD